jgi:hypothetical protein
VSARVQVSVLLGNGWSKSDAWSNQVSTEELSISWYYPFNIEIDINMNLESFKQLGLGAKT